MEIYYQHEHKSCHCYDNGNHPMVEILKIPKGMLSEAVFSNNKIVFLLEGTMRTMFRDQSEIVCVRGDFIFAPVGSSMSYKAVKNCMVMTVAVTGNIQLCRGFDIENLYKKVRKLPHRTQLVHNKVMALKMNRQLWNFTETLSSSLADGLLCKYYFDLKAKELFILLRAYYTKEDLREFFYYILSPDTSFSEFVQSNWLKFDSIQNLAKESNMSVQNFNKRFKNIFGMPPGTWMAHEKARCILADIQKGEKNYQQIAAEYGFSATSGLIRFCNKNFGETPKEIRKKSTQEFKKG